MTVGSNDARKAGHAYCAWCGNALVQEARFCPSCGREMPASAVVPDTPPAEWIDDETFNADAQPWATARDDADAGAEARIDSHDSQAEETVFLWQGLPGVDQGDADRRPFSPIHVTKSSQKMLAVLGGALALLLLTSVAGVAGYRHLRDQPARDAFEAAQQAFGPIARSFAEAKDLEQVSFAGERAADAVKRLEAERSAAASVSSDLGNGVTRVLAAQVAVAKAGAQLSDLSESDVTGWGDAHEALSMSTKQLASATSSLRADEADMASDVPSGKALLTNLESVVGSAVASVAEASLTSLLAELGSAKNTADVRSVAETAARDSESTKAAAEGMVPGTQDAEELEGFVSVYEALAGLGALDSESLDDWGSMRQSLSTALGGVTSGSSVSTSGSAAVESVNRLVERGRILLSDWQAKYDAAVKDKAADSTALDEYSKQMEAQMRAYSALRADLSEWIARVDDPNAYVTYDDAYSVLSQAQWERQVIRDEMNGLAVPTEMEAAHSGLVGVVDDAISAMQSAYDGATDSDYCMTSCYYAETPGWTRFSSESDRITEAYRTADDNWQAAVASAQSSVADRKLPRKPVV